MSTEPGRPRDCVKTASCEEGDHTYTWPCDLAPGTGREAES